MKLSADQALALKTILHWYETKESQYITLGGYAGTGKTTLIAIIKDYLSNKKIKMVLCSYTGRATQNLKNKLSEVNVLRPKDKVSTIHGLIYDPIENNRGIIVGWKKKDEVDAELIIIDEASMVDSKIWSDLLSYNIPVIAVGDHGQLPPINGQFNLMQNPKIKLEKIHRQAEDNPIIQISKSARLEGYIQPRRYSPRIHKYSQEDQDYHLASSDLLESYSEDMLILCGYNHTRVKINQFIRNSLGFETSEPQIGDRVICLRNNHKKNIYNGMLGTISAIYHANERYYEAEIKMDDFSKPYEGVIYAQQFNSAESINFTKERSKIGKADLFDFGYALTVHKAQGSEAKRVVLFEERFKKMDDDQWRKWLYTAVTRAKEELYIFGA